MTAQQVRAIYELRDMIKTLAVAAAQGNGDPDGLQRSYVHRGDILIAEIVTTETGT